MRNAFCMLGVGLAMLTARPGYVQIRPGQPPTLAPPALLTTPPPSIIGPFADAYRGAGQPTVVLFWNVEFDDETESTRESVDVTRESRTPDLGERVVHTQSDRVLNPAKRSNAPLTPRVAAELESAFRTELRLGKMHILDRDKAVRFTQAERDRAGVDPKLIETDAVRGKADILLEVLLVRDWTSELSIGFQVALTDVKTGEELETFYTLAQPVLRTAPGRYVGTEHGFVWEQPTGVAATPVQVGTELADELMQSLTVAFGKKAAAARG